MNVPLRRGSQARGDSPGVFGDDRPFVASL
jgi:hypothetical protein